LLCALSLRRHLVNDEKSWRVMDITGGAMERTVLTELMVLTELTELTEV
jgi:hypothetical protein